MKLSSQAIQVLKELKEGDQNTVSELEEQGYDQSMVNRAALELEKKNLVNTEKADELAEIDIKLTDDGEEILEKGKSPEYNLLKKAEEGLSTSDEFWNKSVSIGKAQEKRWISIENGEINLTDKGLDVNTDEVYERLRIIAQGGSAPNSNDLSNRDLIRTEKIVPKKILLTEKGKEIELEELKEDFNVEASVKTPRTGKKHYYKNILLYARQTWMEMGFEEMGGDYVVPSFLNFDALYTPQDHPARELHDTFFVENPETADLSEYGDKVEHVRETHENGWSTGSKGYGSDWNKEEAEKNVIRTHTTAISARTLHEIDINEEELPKKFFIVGKNFRNETVDRTHLAEFYQTDGIVVGKDLNFKNLKGYISEFFEKMGYDKFRLIPSYYPYTEMSVEVQVWDEEDEEWLGMGGAGMFRPEVVKPMLGFEAKVLAWGLGIPRIAAIAAGLTDIRELYRNDIDVINSTPVWRPDWNNETKGGN